jgi:hypothetical protein
MDDELAVIDPIYLAQLMDVDESSIPEWGFAVIGVLGDDGVSRLETTTYGEPSVGVLIGVLEIVKAEIIAQVFEED